jgi:hypothetical protein
MDLFVIALVSIVSNCIIYHHFWVHFEGKTRAALARQLACEQIIIRKDITNDEEIRQISDQILEIINEK